MLMPRLQRGCQKSLFFSHPVPLTILAPTLKLGGERGGTGKGAFHCMICFFRSHRTPFAYVLVFNGPMHPDFLSLGVHTSAPSTQKRNRHECPSSGDPPLSLMCACKLSVFTHRNETEIDVIVGMLPSISALRMYAVCLYCLCTRLHCSDAS